ncbi:MAG: hypothetical protein ACM3O3_12770 [Syntrophothermus sp.]
MERTVNIFKNYTENKVFIETGSYKGDGIEKALEAGFDKIISIEITPEYYELCVEKFKDNENVKIYLGDSVKLLSDILNDINEPVVLWLDAHYTEPTTLYGDKMCPVLDEINIIKEHAKKYNDIILIDDMRCWTEDNFNYQNYLFNNDDIKNKLKEIDLNVELSLDYGCIPDDVLVAKYNHDVKEEVKNNTKKSVKKTSKTKKR